MAAIVGCSSHTVGDCPPSYATVEGGTGSFEDGGAAALEEACEKLCGVTDCTVANETQLLCPADCL